MRAAQIDEAGVVYNYAEVSDFTDTLIDPLDSVIGSTWNGVAFDPPPPPPLPEPPPQANNESLITDSYNASLKRKAKELENEGKTFEAVQLLLQAQGVQS